MQSTRVSDRTKTQNMKTKKLQHYGLSLLAAGAGLFGVLLPAAIIRGTPLRDALLYGGGYALTMLALCAILAAGGRMERLNSVGRLVCVAAGWCLFLVGAVQSLA